MGLDCIPEHPNRRILFGHTHHESKPCPFQQGEFPSCISPGCCWLRGKIAAANLMAFGETKLADRMFNHMNAKQALYFSKRLTRAADVLERRHRKTSRKPRGCSWGGTWDRRKKRWVNKQYSTFEEGIATIREASRWYERVGKNGCRIYAWY